MEGFFEDLIQDVLAFHEKNRTTIMNLPVALRVRQAVIHLRTLREGSDDNQKWNVIQKFRSEQLYDEVQQCDPGVLDASLHTKGFASPGSDELARLFSSVGFHALWDDVSARPQGTLLKGTLDALVYRRHDVAHGNMQATITPDDMILYLDEMRRLADRSDVVVGEWLEGVHGRKNPWGLLL